MSKRRRESTSSFSSSGDESDNTDSSMSGQPRKTAKSSSAEQMEPSSLASTSTQLNPGLGVNIKQEPEECGELGTTVKEELEEREVANEETDELTVYPDLRIDHSYSCPSSSTGQQSTSEVRRSKRVSPKVQKISVASQQQRPSKTVAVSNPHEKYFEGCLVMGKAGWIIGYPFLPGMIRKASGDGYTRSFKGKTEFFVQFFTNPTISIWQLPINLKLFDDSKPYQRDPRKWVDNFIVDFEAMIRIAKAAVNFSVETRLVKFTLPENAKTDDLLREIESDADGFRDSSVAPTSGLGAEDHVLQIDSGAQDENELPAHRNRKSIPDVIAGLKNQAKLLVQKDLEKEQVIKALTNYNSKLKSANRDLKLQLQSKDELIAELHANLSKSDKDKLECRQQLEIMRSELEGLEGIFKSQLEHK